MLPTSRRPHFRLGKRLSAFVSAALIVTITLALLELALRVIDPWGIHYFTDLEMLVNQVFIPDAERGYAMRDGSYRFSRWSATIQDGARVVPATHAAAGCTVVLLGDSVTFGLGVSDDQTWANGIAARFPDARFINAGVVQYNSGNVLGTLRAYPDADALLYLVIYNDVNPAINMAGVGFAGARSGDLMMSRYINFAIRRGDGSDRPVFSDPAATLPDSAELARFLDEITAITADERVTLAAFDAEPLTNTLLARGVPLEVLPPYPGAYRNSFVDYHLNAAGNALTADALAPIIARMIAARCG
jgi:lysophospholipase L1-like esterase